MMNRRWRHYAKFPPILFTEASYTGSRLQQVKRCKRNKLLKVGKSHVTEYVETEQWRIQGEAPPTDQNFLNFTLFFGNVYVRVFPWRVGAPSYGKSWIRPCRGIYKYWKYMNDPMESVSVCVCHDTTYSSDTSRILRGWVGGNSQSGCANLLFCKSFVKNKTRMKINEFGPRGGHAILAPPSHTPDP